MSTSAGQDVLVQRRRSLRHQGDAQAADPTAADKVRHGAEQSFAAGQDALRGEQVGLVEFTDRARWLPGPDKRFRVAHM